VRHVTEAQPSVRKLCLPSRHCEVHQSWSVARATLVIGQGWCMLLMKPPPLGHRVVMRIRPLHALKSVCTRACVGIQGHSVVLFTAHKNAVATGYCSWATCSNSTAIQSGASCSARFMQAACQCCEGGLPPLNSLISELGPDQHQVKHRERALCSRMQHSYANQLHPVAAPVHDALPWLPVQRVQTVLYVMRLFRTTTKATHILDELRN
jgi:hypothetical protein